MACFDTGILRTRTKLKFGMKMMQKNFPDFCLFVCLFSFALEKEDYSGLLLVFGQTSSAWILKSGRSGSSEVDWPLFFRAVSFS